MVKKVIKYCATIIGYTIIVGIFEPIINVTSVDAYIQLEHWIGSFFAAMVVYNLQIYFEKINPRKMYHCLGVHFSTIGMVLSTFAFIAMVIWAVIIESTAMKTAWLIIAFLLYLFLIYVFVHRGVAIYKRGKIRIFKFVIKTYNTDKIENIVFDYNGKKCTIHIIVLGNEHIFKLSSSSAKLCEKRLKSIIPHK